MGMDHSILCQARNADALKSSSSQAGVLSVTPTPSPSVELRVYFLSKNCMQYLNAQPQCVNIGGCAAGAPAEKGLACGRATHCVCVSCLPYASCLKSVAAALPPFFGAEAFWPTPFIATLAAFAGAGVSSAAFRFFDAGAAAFAFGAAFASSSRASSSAFLPVVSSPFFFSSACSCLTVAIAHARQYNPPPSS